MYELFVVEANVPYYLDFVETIKEAQEADCTFYRVASICFDGTNSV